MENSTFEETSLAWIYTFNKAIKSNDPFNTDYEIKCPSTNYWQWVYRNKDAFDDLISDGNYDKGVWAVKLNADCSIDPCSCSTYSTNNSVKL